jgi:3-phenylpropionate/trans-cinnamate dioxygenase ferredoxin subunit
MPEYVRVASLSELPPGTLKGVQIGDVGICLANADGTIYAFRDNCSHKDFPLHLGELEGTRLTCEWHGAQFDITSGKAVRIPAIKPIRTFEVKVDGDDILVAV